MISLSTSPAASSSFRDPSGFIFRQDGFLYRQVNESYQENYGHLMASGLYQKLTGAGLLVPHDEVDIPAPLPELAHRVIRPQVVPFVSYPYEWCFSQLKDAALSVLKVQKTCLDFGMSLKDASAYNVQFVNGRPLLIDSLSFEKYREGQPWVAYRQFCQHFLAPLALMSHKDIRLNQLLRVYIDGVPLDLASRLLPMGTRLDFSLLSHLHLHASSQQRFADGRRAPRNFKMGKMAYLGIIDSLESAVSKLRWQPRGTEWSDYYDNTNYSREAFDHKRELVASFIARARPATVWDLGANTGTFSRIATASGAFTVSIDIDPAAVERNYLEAVRRKETNILPLVIDLTNPSPAIGWENTERMTLAERGPADAVIALALIHHLAISNNLPLARVARFLGQIGNWLIIEFVPKGDSQVKRLLATREDIFSHYAREDFERDFGQFFTIEASAPIRNSERTLYLMRRQP